MPRGKGKTSKVKAETRVPAPVTVRTVDRALLAEAFKLAGMDIRRIEIVSHTSVIIRNHGWQVRRYEAA